MKWSTNSCTMLLAVAITATCLPGCAGWTALRQAVKRNTAADVGPPREDRKEAAAKEFDQKRDDAQFEAAVSYWQRGDVKNCNQILDDLLHRNPNNRQARLLLADVYLFNGQLEQSAEEYGKAVATDPKDAAAQHQLAQVLDALGRRPDALSHYQEATRLDPNNEVYSLSFKMASGLIPLSDRNTALAAAAAPLVDVAASTNSISAATANNQRVERDSNIVLTSGSQNPAAAAVPATDLPAASSPHHPPGAPVQSLQSSSSAADGQIDSSPLGRAVTALAVDDTASAIEAASRGLAATPDQSAALYRVLGAAHYRRGEYQAAQAALAQALSLDKSDGLTYFLMGSVLDKLNDHDSAARCLTEAARLDGRFAN